MTHEKKHRYSSTGWWFIRLSVFCIAVFLIDYKAKFIFSLESVSELGTILAGTAGIFASLAGLFFVLDNLELQRETIAQQQESINQQKISIDLQRDELKNQILEMKESNEYFKQQNETLRTQTAESTFFQLLDNHRNLVSSFSLSEGDGYSGLNKYYRVFKSQTILYYRSAVTGTVNDSTSGNYYPLRNLSREIENVEQLYNISLHLISHIKQKLNDDTFYHATFYNSLSNAEKYLLGMYIINDRIEDRVIFQTATFNYVDYFQGSGNAYYDKETIPFYPHLSFTFLYQWNKINLNSCNNNTLDSIIGEIKIEALKNEPNHKIVLKELKLVYEWEGAEYSEKEIYTLEIDEQKNINIIKLLYDTVIKRFVSQAGRVFKEPFSFYFAFNIFYVFDCNDKSFTYRKVYRAEFREKKEATGECDLNIAETH